MRVRGLSQTPLLQFIVDLFLQTVQQIEIVEFGPYQTQIDNLSSDNVFFTFFTYTNSRTSTNTVIDDITRPISGCLFFCRNCNGQRMRNRNNAVSCQLSKD